MPSRVSVELRLPSGRTKVTRWRVRYTDPNTGRERAKHFPTEDDAQAFRETIEVELPERVRMPHNGGAAQRAREMLTARPAPTDGPYAIICPDCRAQPGQWCEAVHTLPPGTLLRDPHDKRRQRAAHS